MRQFDTPLDDMFEGHFGDVDVVLSSDDSMDLMCGRATHMFRYKRKNVRAPCDSSTAAVLLPAAVEQAGKVQATAVPLAYTLLAVCLEV